MGRYHWEISWEEDAFMVSRVRGVALLGMMLVLGVIQVGNADGQSQQRANLATVQITPIFSTF
jgi:hypothetical protein